MNEWMKFNSEPDNEPKREISIKFNEDKAELKKTYNFTMPQAGLSTATWNPQLCIYKTIWDVVLIFSTSEACAKPLLMSKWPADRQSLAAWDGNLILLRYRKRQRKFKIDNDSEGRRQWDNIINDYLLFQMSTEEAFGMGRDGMGTWSLTGRE